ncbi:MAG: peptide ABC transporter substrate-binding protein [Pasteurellaceae bacterium]|nr:peptide ABC transporter substrate-binding protein [Pasteurellaceae bacterium]
MIKLGGAFLVFFAKKSGYLIVCLLLLACEPEKKPIPVPAMLELTPSSQLNRAIYANHLQLDPHFVTTVAESAPIRDLLVGLMAYDSRGNVIPAVATDIFSDDGVNWLLQLDQGRVWSNGDAVTAEDFVASWQRLADPANHSPLADYLIYMGILNAKEVIHGELPPSELGLKALNTHSLQIQLHQPHYQLPNMLAHLALLPTYQGQKPQVDQPFISNGDYRLSSWHHLGATLQAVVEDLAFQTVRYQLVSEVQNVDRFDIVENPLPSYQRDLIYLPRLCSYFYEFNFTDPKLRNKVIRQAIRTMLSPSEVGDGFGIPTHSLVPKALFATHDRHLDKATAEQLLEQANVDLQHPLRLHITYDQQDKHQVIANRILRVLSRSDLFQVQLHAVDWGALLAKRQKKAFELIRSGWCADYPDPAVFLMPFHSKSPDNKSGYQNKLVDQYLERLQQTQSSGEREQLIFNIVQHLENDVVVLPLFQYQRRLTVAPDIIGVDLRNHSEVIYSKDLYRQ